MVTKRTTLKAWSKNDDQPPIKINQGDMMSRHLEITLADANGQPVDLTGASARLHLAKPDRTVVYINAVITNEKAGRIQAILTSQVAAAAGLVKATVQITWLQGEVSRELFCSGLTLQVLPNNVSESVESSNEFSALLALQLEGGATFDDLSLAIDSANAAGNFLTGATIDANEVKDGLDASIASGTSLANDLEQNIATGNQLKGDLEVAIDEAEQAIADLEPIQQQIDALDAGKLDKSEKGSPNGVATLGTDGKLAQMPTAGDVKAAAPSEFLNLIYPVGSIYMSVNAVNPSTLFGGTWTAYAQGRAIFGVDPNDTDFTPVGTVGGEKRVTLTPPQMPIHNHNLIYSASATSVGGGVDRVPTSNNMTEIRSNGGTIESAGGGQAHNNMPPYITCYIWQRTA